MRVLATLAACILLTHASPATAQPQPAFAAIDELAASELARQQVPGAALVIVQGDRVIYSKGFGVASAETRQPMSPDMLFRVGSTTKMFVAASVLVLAGQGKLKLDEPVGTWIHGLDPALARLTADQLLTHTAGLMDETRMYGPHDDSALERNVESWDKSAFFTEPGRVYSYSNLGFVLAGRLVEVADGLAFADAVRQLVLAPLGMKASTFRPTMAMTYPLAVGHEGPPGQPPQVSRPMADHAGYWPAGSLFTSANEFARFAIAFLNEGRIDGRQVLAPSLIAAMSRPRAAIPAYEPGHFYSYGLEVHTTRGVRIIEHGGSRTGYSSVLRMAPEQRVAVIALCNRSGSNFGRVAERALQLLVPFETKPEETQAPEPNTIDPKRFAGKYRNGSASWEFKARESTLEVRGHALRPVSDRCFEDDPPRRYCFVATPDGAIRYLHFGGRSFARTD